MKTTRPAKSLVKPVLLALAAGIVAACAGSNASPSASRVPATQSADSSAGPVSTVSINAGGPTIGGFWADRFFTGGATYGNSSIVDTSQITAGPPPAAVFGTERYGAMTYVIPDRSGRQVVTLYFAETYVTGRGQRVFDVSINGTAVLTGFDIFATAGGANRAIASTFQATADVHGDVVIDFIPGTENPKINAITVTGPGTTATPQPPAPSPTPAAPPTNSPDAKASAGCGKTPTLANGTIDIESGGTRSYILRAPDNYDADHPYRLVIAYHWMGGTAQQVADGTGATESPFYGLWGPANNSTIFVAPVGLGSGTRTGWPNVGGGDVAFTDAILAQLENALCIDTSRIFATGFSYGAGMSYALACARPDVFRAVALFSGAQLSGCDGGTAPIAFYASHGIGDSVLDISQGRMLRDHFAEVDGVTPQSPPEPAAGSGTHICTKYDGGSPNYPVEWCAFDGDHTPNPHDAGRTTSWNPPEAWAFISQF